MSTITERWAEVARGALVEVGYGTLPACMPGEAAPCGASAELHALSYFAILKAVADHQLGHLGANPDVVGEIYLHTSVELTDHPGCQGVHP